MRLIDLDKRIELYAAKVNSALLKELIEAQESSAEASKKVRDLYEKLKTND